jgi:hypothetical protein
MAVWRLIAVGRKELLSHQEVVLTEATGKTTSVSVVVNVDEQNDLISSIFPF